MIFPSRRSSYLVGIQADRDAVVRHDPGGPGRDGGAERLEVLGEPAARVDLLAAVREVRVLAVALRAAAGEVLRGAGDGVRPQPRPLESLQVGGDQLRG